MEPGTLAVSTRPWGVLYVDSELIGNTPRTNVQVAAGTHVVRIMRDGFEPFERQIEVAPGQDLRLTDIVLRRVQP
ncbi:MAG: PEGA domain-containing protein [Gemmatimonadota bacterium]|nr:MAG: PEGA domain-containing protein [Gemmatimonadota bacterium]